MKCLWVWARGNSGRNPSERRQGSKNKYKYKKQEKTLTPLQTYHFKHFGREGGPHALFEAAV